MAFNIDEELFLINHVFLPPKLPHAGEKNTAPKEHLLLRLLVESAENYVPLVNKESEKIKLRTVHRMLLSLQAIKTSDTISRNTLSTGLKNLMAGDVIALHIAAQNAGLILRHLGAEVRFESFEASPTTDEVLQATGALRCCYPGPVIAVDLEKFKDRGFLSNLTSYLEQMDIEELEQAQSVTQKAGSDIVEHRETTDPMFITGMLTGVLRGLGRPANAPRIQKRIRDDVLWKDARGPWRRSPFWLVLKVALQTTLNGTEEKHGLYKSFMIYFIANVLERALRHRDYWSSDDLFLMNAKLSRRIHKAGGRVVDSVKHVVNKVSRELQRRWGQIEMADTPTNKWHPDKLLFEQDTKLSLELSMSYFQAAMKREFVHKPGAKFQPHEVPRQCLRFDAVSLPSLDSIESDDGISSLCLCLSDLERWVEHYLDHWLNANIGREAACQELATLTQAYTELAKKVYRNSPENSSLMLLVALELWSALDKVALEHCSLMKDYSPEVPDSLLDPLLLPKRAEMNRLHKIEGYLQNRREAADPKNPPILSDQVNRRTFAVRFYDSFVPHQQLSIEIEEQAERDKEQKIEEHNNKSREYHELKTEVHRMSCEFEWTIDRWGLERCAHSKECERCSLDQEADSMRISLHEWPLPKDLLRKKMTVFEVSCPLVLSVWRDATYRLLVDTCTPNMPSKSGKPKQGDVRSYCGLSRYYSGPARRLSFSSKTKSFGVTHYLGHSFPVSIEKICVNNGMNYFLYDELLSSWACGKDPQSPDVRNMCTLQLPPGPYQKMQYMVDSVTHSSNEVIARQNECPPEISLHEYEAFGGIRAGGRLQWLNISRELRAQNLTFGNEAVGVLLMQAAWQACPGKPGHITREAHFEPSDPFFGEVLLGEIRSVLGKIRENWREIHCAHSLIVLTSRILSLTSFEYVKHIAAETLKEARRVTLGWTQQLANRLNLTEHLNDEIMEPLRLRLLLIAATCRVTYDVDDVDLHRVLASDEDIEVAIECGIVLHDNWLVREEETSPILRSLLDRNRRLSLTLETELRRLICQPQPCKAVDTSIKRMWSDFVPGERWEAFPEPNDRWIFTRTGRLDDSTVRGSTQRLVQFNLLSSQLLIDGKPLKRLPHDYLTDPMYFRTFGKKIFDVSPSTDMDYQSKYKVNGFLVSFSLEHRKLLIRAKKDGRTLELIPDSKLDGEFPRRLVKEYAHWLDVGSGEIEFRPLSSQWTESSRNPRVYLHERELRDGNRRFIDVRSASALMIYSTLRPLERREFIEISIFNSVVEIHLPRLNLNFSVNQRKQLECRQFRDMIIDENQHVGTLIGLENRLCLRDKRDEKEYHVRKVLIPYGEITYGKLGFHIRAQVNTSEEKVVYHVFDIDTTLWRLFGDSSLTSRLYKTYLHAITSHCLPDPLTRRTGTEEALYDLRCAATWSFKELGQDDLHLLELIASLTPIRVYYPKHLKKMQTVDWIDLPSMSQHEDFYQVVQELLRYDDRFKFFRDSKRPSSALGSKKTIPHLIERAAVRNGTFRIEEFGGANIAHGRDRVYTARHELSDAAQTLEAKVCAVAGKTYEWATMLDVVGSGELLTIYEGWGQLAGPTNTILLGYQSQLLSAKLPDIWCSLFSICRKAKRSDKYSLMFLLSTLVYAWATDPNPQIGLQLIWTLLACATVLGSESLALPSYNAYDLSKGYHPGRQEILQTTMKFAVKYRSSAEFNLPRWGHESHSSWTSRKLKLYRDNLESQARGVTEIVLSQWICETPAVHGDFSLIKMERLGRKLGPIFRECYKNMRLREHIKETQSLLDDARANGTPLNRYAFSTSPQTLKRHSCISTTPMWRVVLDRAPPLFEAPIPPSTSRLPFQNAPTETGALRNLLRRLCSRDLSQFESEYVDDLMKSVDSFQRQFALVQQQILNEGQKDLSLSLSDVCGLERCKPDLGLVLGERKSDVESMFKALLESLTLQRNGAVGEDLLQATGLWPRITPTSLLRLLATPVTEHLNDAWKRTLVEYGLAITGFQRVERLHVLSLMANQQESQKEFIKELGNPGHQNWDPAEYPDWLLLEIENNLLIRPIQAQIAKHMILPPSDQSSVIQLNMGEGKSSVIVPIVSAALANTERLVRVVVLKPLSAQMHHLLVQKLSSLCNRRIYWLPFSRRTPVDASMSEESMADEIRALYEECTRQRGILLVQPEHLHSFKLMGLEKLSRPESRAVAKKLLDTQQWLEKTARDILDESDELLHVRYQLIYTLGDQKCLDFSPLRWVIVQDLLGLVRNRVEDLQRVYPRGVEVYQKSLGGFPNFRILEDVAGAGLCEGLVSDISEGKLPEISFRLWLPGYKKLAVKFIRDSAITEVEYTELFKYCDEPTNRDKPIKKCLFLLRGLLAHGIVITALRDRRWRVDYGLDGKRNPPTLLAVPYRAKDCPAQRAEFSHPDMAIVLTCLSYYYGGLLDSQLEVAFAALAKTNHPSAEYQKWVDGDSLPECIRTLAGVNLDDPEQRSTLVFPQLRNRKTVIDFYLSNVVFPRDSKEFPHKLSTSGWDLAEKRAGLPTTGFSGTIDNRYLLPLTVKQPDLLENRGTNAKVLSYLLKDENDCYEHITFQADGKVDALLGRIADFPQIKVILDVGAQILLPNEAVAKKLLDQCHDDDGPKGVVYFNDNDELVVEEPGGTAQLLLFSPFAKQLDKCYVYLDEQHTRGTDLKLPVGSRAAVTLGPKLTKDRLVQACMRMRMLGDGHSVMYFAPSDVHQKISKIAGRFSDDGETHAMDVLHWTIEETWLSIKNSVSLWASQGLSYQKRQKAWLEYCNPTSSAYMNEKALFAVLREPESQDLEGLYGPQRDKGYHLSTSLEPQWEDDHKDEMMNIQVEDQNIVAIRSKCAESRVPCLDGVRLQEEQEREVAQEAEQERLIERPLPAKPATHYLHNDVVSFVANGREPCGSAFRPAFSILDTTSASQYTVQGWSSQLLVTCDFWRTIVENSDTVLDDYLRPVNWVLENTHSTSKFYCVIISPFEANELLPNLRVSNSVRLHIYSPRVTRDMRTFEDLQFYSIPNHPSVNRNVVDLLRDLEIAQRQSCINELNIYAGQLCLRDYTEYKEVCAFLGLYLGSALRDGDQGYIDSEGGFVSLDGRKKLGMHPSPFRDSPVMVVRALMALRRKRQDYMETHMGRLLRGILLTEEAFK